MSSESCPRVRTALVVEDDPTLCRTLAELLQDDGFEVKTATTLQSARRALLESSSGIGVVLLDLALPDGHGEELLAELSTVKKAPPTVVMSALPVRAQHAADAYGVASTAKPLDLALVATTVRVAFENDIRPRDPRGGGRRASTRRFRAA